MKEFFAGLRRWWHRRFRGYVAAPAGSRGTNWQEHRRDEIGFTCRCGRVLAFSREDLHVRDRQHIEGCLHASGMMPTCGCPIRDARYVKLCPGCGLGHWKDATQRSIN
jgi:hypothetical protein